MDKTNIIKLLKHLEFQEKNHIFSKKYLHTTLEIDTQKEYIAYKEFGIKVGDKTTSNFSSDENFVVLECVDRLLSKGYQKEHIELEPKWKLGRGASGGKADILVKDKANKPLLIIECKTYGKEYEKEILNMKNDGGQLFSYFAQERATKYLCLYASRLNKNQIEYENKIIKTSKEYEKAKNNAELFEVWKIKYLRSFNDNGIFEKDIQAYNIELQAKKRRDLKALPENNKIYNQFMEILRHHNISEKERAFNKIISLFLCKIVDETKEAHQEVDFQYKNGIDDIYTMQDKLLNLFHIGMKDYLKEEVTYIKESEIEKTFKFYSKKTALNEVLEMFREQKYHSNNEFTFLDVNSKELFYKNAEVLKEVVELFEEYQFSYTHKEQILGNFFENLLSRGFKQSEGQFFTPVPITKFIMMSLPLDAIIEQKQEKGETYPLPYLIDYACGSAHFLTEAIDEISTEIKALELSKYQEDTSWVKEHIYGIEKDYRLSRTAKVACFLNGAGDTNIIYGDGLAYREDLPEGRLDVVVANPPYSVKDFKNFSQANSDNYTLFDALTNSSSEIEVLFLEKTSQLLTIGGYGAIILPSSILSNGGIYAKARKLLLEDFYIKAITEFGSNTFGATGTNTVTLFLEKRQTQDKIYFSESAKLLFQNQEKLRRDNYNDDNYLSLYSHNININYEDYQTLLQDNINEKLKKSEWYKSYQKWFDNLTEIKNLKKQKTFKSLSQEEKKQKLDKELRLKIKANEEEKFKYFCLSLESNQKTTIIKTGEKQAEKEFLGYEWSNRKGSEGIKIYEESKLYDENNKTNPLKANSYIRSAFLNQDLEIDKSLENNIFKYNLVDLIDFKKVDFDCAIGLSIKKDMEIKSKWDIVKLGDVIKANGGNGFPTKYQGKKEGIAFLKVSDMNTLENIPVINIANNYVHQDILKKQIKSTIFSENTIIFPKVGQAIHTNKKRILGIKASIDNNIMALTVKNRDKLNSKYLLEYFESFINLSDISSTSNPPSISATNLNEVKIPLPPLDIQEKIVNEIEIIEEQNQILKDENSRLKNEIEDIIESVDGDIVKLEDISSNLDGERIPISKLDREKGIYPYYGASGIVDYVDSYIFNDTLLLVSEDGANLKSRVTPIAFTATGKYWVNNHSHILKFNNIETHKIVELYLNKLDLNEYLTGQAQPKLTQKNLNNIKIPLPSLKEQKEIIEKIEKLEYKINENSAILENEKKDKDKILKRYL